MGLDVAFVDLEPALPHLTTMPLMPRHDLLSVATVSSQAGHRVSVFIECLNGLPVSELKSKDVIGASLTVCCHNRVRKLLTDLRRENPNLKLIVGGPHATLIPTDVLEFADVAVRDEGEGAITELLSAFEKGTSLENIAGISYWSGDQVVHNPRRAFLERPGLVEDLGLLQDFRRKSLISQLVRDGGFYSIYATASRGCPFPCTFCWENMVGGTGFRRTPAQSFVEDVRRKVEFFGTREVWLADSNFSTNPSHCREILEAIIDAKLDCRFHALSRVDVGPRADILALMKKAGFETLILGMEAIRDDQLATIEKQQTVREIQQTIENIHSHGMAVFGLFMVGFDEDTAETPHEITEFCESNGVDGLSLFCLTEYPTLPGRTLPRYRICEPDYDYYNGNFVTTFPKRVRPSVLEKSVFNALKRFYGPGKCASAIARGDTRRLKLVAPLSWQIRKMARHSIAHQEMLREREEPYYDASGTLNEELLRSNPIVQNPLPDFGIADWRDAGDVSESGQGSRLPLVS